MLYVGGLISYLLEEHADLLGIWVVTHSNTSGWTNYFKGANNYSREYEK